MHNEQDHDAICVEMGRHYFLIVGMWKLKMMSEYRSSARPRARRKRGRGKEQPFSVVRNSHSIKLRRDGG